MALRWLPLESNPDVLNQFLRELGLPEPWGISDVLTLDVDAVDLVPQPAFAVILLLPVTQKYTEYVQQLEVDLEKAELPLPLNADIYFMKQTIRNACGTVALIHAIANNLDELHLMPESILKKFLDASKELTPEERGQSLEKNVDIANLHEAGAQEGQSETAGLDDEVDLHFITLVNIADKIVELDGRKSKPLVHCLTTKENFLKDAFRVCHKYISIDPYNLRYNALSLGLLEASGDP